VPLGRPLLSRLRNARLLLVLLAAGLAAGALLLRHSLARQLQSKQAAVARWEAAGLLAPVLPTSKHDFVLKLPQVPLSPQVFLAHAQAAAQPHGVTVAAFSSSSRPATTMLLARAGLQMSLHGGYADVKQTLAELLGRHPDVVLQQLSMRRSNAGPEVEAQVQAILLGRPLTTPPTKP
jgi:hypothetical protein